MRGKSLMRKLAQTAKGALKTLAKAAVPVGMALGGAIAYSDHKTKEFQKEIEASKPDPAPSSTVKPSKVDRDYTDTAAFKMQLDSDRSRPKPAWMSPAAQKAQAVKRKAQWAQMNRDTDTAIAAREKQFKAKIKKSEEKHAQHKLHEDILQKKRVAEQKLRRKGKG